VKHFFSGPHNKGGLAKIFILNQKDLISVPERPGLGPKGVSLYSQQIMILLRKTKTSAI
jgi:hypothetical protein